jgi:hypothetical protein
MAPLLAPAGRGRSPQRRVTRAEALVTVVGLARLELATPQSRERCQRPATGTYPVAGRVRGAGGAQAAQIARYGQLAGSPYRPSDYGLRLESWHRVRVYVDDRVELVEDAAAPPRRRRRTSRGDCHGPPAAACPRAGRPGRGREHHHAGGVPAHRLGQQLRELGPPRSHAPTPERNETALIRRRRVRGHNPPRRPLGAQRTQNGPPIRTGCASGAAAHAAPPSTSGPATARPAQVGRQEGPGETGRHDPAEAGAAPPTPVREVVVAEASGRRRPPPVTFVRVAPEPPSPRPWSAER